MPSLEEVTEDNNSTDAGRMAALLGVHLVSQVLDEACSIVNTAQKTGWFKDLSSGRLYMTGQTNEIEIVQDQNENFIEKHQNITHLTTSTPHKDEIKSKPDNSFIGQGDEEIDIVSKEGIAHHDDEFRQGTGEIILESEAQNLSSDIMIAIMDKLFETALVNSYTYENLETDGKEMSRGPENTFKTDTPQGTPPVPSETNIIETEEDEESNSPEEFCISFLENACGGNIGDDIAFYLDEDAIDQIKVVVKADIHAEITETLDAGIEEISDEVCERVEKLEAARYEDAYLSLNRDYEQCSQCSDDGDPVLQDPKTPMQEVELFAASTEDEDDDNSSDREPEEERKELAAISAVSGASGSRKSRISLVSRCRSQGARLLSCLRGWWRRKTPGKRKEARPKGSVHGICPLSPLARRRAASLLDQRQTYSPAPSRSVVWKFNTINEALVKSSKWKEYTYEVNPDGCGEHC